MPKKNKFNARKVQLVDGMSFDSIKEKNRYIDLKAKQVNGEIHDLMVQVPFELIPSQKGEDKKVIERAVNYVADFVYVTKDGEQVVEDVKGYRKGAAYATYVIKRKLMLWVHGIRIKEI